MLRSDHHSKPSSPLSLYKATCSFFLMITFKSTLMQYSIINYCPHPVCYILTAYLFSKWTFVSIDPFTDFIHFPQLPHLGLW